MSNSPRTSWQPFKDLEDTTTGVIVRINTLPVKNPLFSVEVGTRAPDGSDFIRRHIPATLLHSAFELMDKASELIAEEMAKAQTALEDFTTREREKKAQYLANVERRKEENRARASRNPGKKKEK